MDIKHWIVLTLMTVVLAACGGGYDTQSSTGAGPAASTDAN